MGNGPSYWPIWPWGLVVYGLIERQREELGLSFYPCRRKLIPGRLSLDLSPLLSVQVEAA